MSDQDQTRVNGSAMEDSALAFVDGSTGVEVEDVSADESIVEPFDPTLIRVETRPFTIDLLVSRLRESELNLAPDFQRHGGIWTDEAQSRLIESILIRIPLPAFYMDATDEESWIVVDGLQRITALDRFIIKKELTLSGLEFLTALNGKKFDDLSRTFQRRIGETQVVVYLIEKGTPPEVKFNIFKRINTGGLPLSPQEIRHALNQGPATKLLSELAGSPEFKRATDSSIRDYRMADRECVLRFLAFYIRPYTNYRAKDLDRFLNDVMSEINSMSTSHIGELRQQFLRVMAAAWKLFGRDAFRKRYYPSAARYPLNKALFEAWSVNLAMLNDEQLSRAIANKDDVKERFRALMQVTEFDRSVSQSTGDPARIRFRFAAIEKLLADALK